MILTVARFPTVFDIFRTTSVVGAADENRHRPLLPRDPAGPRRRELTISRYEGSPRIPAESGATAMRPSAAIGPW
jgi:hypothetical protein